MQLICTIPKIWKSDLAVVKENIHNLVIRDHHLITKSIFYFLFAASIF